jgi:hypothetical protein
LGKDLAPGFAVYGAPRDNVPNGPFGHGGVGALDASIEMLQV